LNQRFVSHLQPTEEHLDFRFIIVLIVIVYLLLAFGGCLDQQTHLPSAMKPLPTTEEYLSHARNTVHWRREIDTDRDHSFDWIGLGLDRGHGVPTASPG
jgi:hypothetical protein